MTYQSTHGGVSPSLRELAAALGLSHPAQVHSMLISMQARGALRRWHGRARAIQVLRQRVPVVTYVDAGYFVVERIDGEARLVPLKK